MEQKNLFYLYQFVPVNFVFIVRSSICYASLKSFSGLQIVCMSGGWWFWKVIFVVLITRLDLMVPIGFMKCLLFNEKFYQATSAYASKRCGWLQKVLRFKVHSAFTPCWRHNRRENFPWFVACAWSDGEALPKSRWSCQRFCLQRISNLPSADARKNYIQSVCFGYADWQCEQDWAYAWRPGRTPVPWLLHKVSIVSK